MNIDSVVKIVSIVISILSLLGVGTIMTMFWKDKHDKRQKENEENSKLREEKRLSEIQEVVEKAIDRKLSPIQDELAHINSDMQMVKRGVQVSCRTDLEEMYLKAEHDGYCSDYDKKRFEVTYQAYHALGKNGVMDGKYKKILDLPESAPKRTKVKLNEGRK